MSEGKIIPPNSTCPVRVAWPKLGNEVYAHCKADEMVMLVEPIDQDWQMKDDRLPALVGKIHNLRQGQQAEAFLNLLVGSAGPDLQSGQGMAERSGEDKATPTSRPPSGPGGKSWASNSNSRTMRSSPNTPRSKHVSTTSLAHTRQSSPTRTLPSDTPNSSRWTSS